jgi:putative DNA primase/helicase
MSAEHIARTLGGHKSVAGDPRELLQKDGLQIWRASKPGQDTPVQTYLSSYSISGDVEIHVPEALRFHPGLRHSSGQIWPAMVAVVSDGRNGNPGIHCTFQKHDGGGEAPVEPSSLMLGTCRGGAVRLAPANDIVMIDENIKNCVLLTELTGCPAWAIVSKSGMEELHLPKTIRTVIVLVGGDEARYRAALHPTLRWKQEGRKVLFAGVPGTGEFPL